MGGWIRSSSDPFIALNSTETLQIVPQTTTASSIIGKTEPNKNPPGGFRHAMGFRCADVPQEHPPPLNLLCNLSLCGAEKLELSCDLESLVDGQQDEDHVPASAEHPK